MSKYEEFLQTDFDVHEDDTCNDSAQIEEIEVETNIELKKKSRPRLLYLEGSISTKRRRILEMCEQFSEEELLRALKLKRKDEREREKEDDLSMITMPNKSHSLAMYMDVRLSQKRYRKLIAHGTKLAGGIKFLPYSHVVKAK